MSSSSAGSGVDASAIIFLLTPERMASYLNDCGGDHGRALALYDWNTRAAGALLGIVGMTEVVVRNALDAQLQELALSRAWQDWLHEAPLDKQGRRDVAQAQERLTMRGRRDASHGKLIAELSLGFWRYLCASRYYTSLWVPALTRAFPQGASDIRARQQQVEGAMRGLVYVRNRAAHHEPLHRRDLTADLRRASQLMSWVDDSARIWLEASEQLTTVVKGRPARS